ncbi:cold shock domain-containing protein [Chryseolinea sp. H1M3-3]|uniref:cold-shock protein n=1 Tax=Chryseolinea sp. H1M3-3 TaxID=3034144 RepID=UPI0023EB0948|nr:cold shock domain-containing protein [Chryseolinea sp. H1M3-3]
MAKSQNRSIKNEKEKKKLQKRQEKEHRKEERKANARDGNSLDDMMAYVDEYGNISTTPPDPMKKINVKATDIVIGVPTQSEEKTNSVRKGQVTFFNAAKGYGFIKDNMTGDSIFVHANSLTTSIDKDDHVEFETQRGPRGLSAINVQKKKA